MKIKIIDFKSTKIAIKIKKTLNNNKNECVFLERLEEINEDDFIIWIVQGETFDEIINSSRNIRKHLSLSQILFVTAFDNDKIVLGPKFTPNITSGLDSAIFFLYQKKNKVINDSLITKIKLPLFDKVLNSTFYDFQFFKLIYLIEKELNIFKKENGKTNYNNCIEVIDVNSFDSVTHYIYPIFEMNYKEFFSKKTEDLMSDIKFINQSKKEFKFKSKKRLIKYKSIAVLGGGTAGYMSAISLKNKYPEIKVKLIESKKNPIIGVGEATTPDLVDWLFNKLKFDKLEFYKEVQPTWKLGIKFYWGQEGDYTFNYPFGNHDLISAYLNDNIDGGSLTSILMTEDSSFVIKNESNGYECLSQPEINYAFHLDNEKFVSFLKKKANELGIIRIEDTIEKIILNKSKTQIERIKLEKTAMYINHDLYIDCTGFKSLLINELDNSYVSFKDNLITDRAIVFKVPNYGKVKPYTLAESMNNGWCWNIPMRDSDHRGYVYSSKFCNEDDALSEIKIKYPFIKDYKLIKFNSGRHDSFIKGNVIAIGNSYGFVEPLESTGIHMIIRHIKSLVDNLEDLQFDDNNGLKKFLNQEMRNRWDYLKWFLSIHYKFNNKYDTSFWKFCRSNINLSSFQNILDIYTSNGPLQMLSSDTKNNLAKKYVDDLFGIYGIDNILLGQGVIPKNMQKYQPIGSKLWNFNQSIWKSVSKKTIPLKNDIKILTENPELL